MYLCRVREIEDDLEAAIFTCKESRADMAIAKQQFTTKSLGILANYRKRQAALNLLSSLRTIDTLVSSNNSEVSSKIYSKWFQFLIISPLLCSKEPKSG